jgi:hypothetical protein
MRKADKTNGFGGLAMKDEGARRQRLAGNQIVKLIAKSAVYPTAQYRPL